MRGLFHDEKVASDLVCDEGHADGEVGDHPEADDDTVEDDDGALGGGSQPGSQGECQAPAFRWTSLI